MSSDWSQITYMVYDAPLLKMEFADRLKVIEEVLAKNPQKNVKLLKQEVCQGQEHLDKELKKVLADKGEGLMIKDPHSLYEPKRSKKLLKIK